MKLFLILSFLMSSAFASTIEGSKFESRHQKLITDAISKECAFMGSLAVVTSHTQVIQIDQGIRDMVFNTVFRGVVRIDQGVFDSYKITVESLYSDQYDHSSGNWGAYSVTSVKCEME
jgi:hypothetical protein